MSWISMHSQCKNIYLVSQSEIILDITFKIITVKSQQTYYTW